MACAGFATASMSTCTRSPKGSQDRQYAERPLGSTRDKPDAAYTARCLKG
jgi:hypothetical protein